MFADDIKNEN